MTSNASTNSDTPKFTTSGSTTLTTLQAQSYHQTSTRTPSGTASDAIFYRKATMCHCRGKLLDVRCTHAGCCATAEATRGHYTVVRAIAAVAKAIDPTTSR